MVGPAKVVVIAENETFVRLVAAEILIDAGFEVFETCHAEEALAALLERAGRVHLLFTDIHMPGLMNGLDLAHHVRGRWPHVALLIASGQIRPTAAELPQGSRFLSKPYEPEHVVAHAHELTAA